MTRTAAPTGRGRARLASVLVAGLIACAAAGPAPARAVGGPNGVEVTIVTRGGAGQATLQLPFATVFANPDVGTDQSTPVLRSDGTRTTIATGGTSAQHLVALAGVAPSSVDHLEIPRSSGTTFVTIPGDRLRFGYRAPGEDEPRQALFEDLYADRVSFFRPLGDDGLPNDVDQVDAPIGEDLPVRIFVTGGLLSVAALAGAEKVDSGVPIRFSGRSDAPEATFTWTFGDGAQAVGADVSHAFPDGTFAVTVTAATTSGAAGVSRPLAITVGNRTGGGSATTPAPPTPPVAEGDGGVGSGAGQPSTGGGSAGPGAVASGPSARPQRATGTPRPTRRPTPRRPAKRRRAEARKPVATTRPTPAGPRAAASGSSSTGTGRGRVRATGSGAAAARRGPRQPAATAADAGRPAPPVHRRSSATPTGARDRLRGTLVADRESPLSEALAAADALARTPEPDHPPVRAAAGGHGKLVGWLSGGGVLLGLLAVGALREGLRPLVLLRPLRLLRS